MLVLLALVASVHAACTVTPAAPAPALAITGPTLFRWTASGDCASFRVQLSASPAFPPGTTNLAWVPATRTSERMTETAYGALTAAGTSTVSWRVQSRDTAGTVAVSPARRLTLQDTDLDGDAQRDVAYGGTDCDDADATVYDGAPEAADGVDTDCDGLGDYAGNLTFGAGSAAAMAALCADYDVVDGHLEITRYDGADLAGLSCLQLVSGSLSISDNPYLTSLTGLDALEEVEGNFALGSVLLRTNPLLADATGLGSLRRVGGRMYLVDTLDTCEGLGALESVGDTLYIGDAEYGAPSPASLVGLDGLTTVGSLVQTGSSLTDFTGLESLTTVEDDLTLYYSRADSLAGLGGVTEIGGNLSISTAYDLVDLQGLSGVTRIVGEIDVQGYNPYLTSLAGLDSLARIGEITLGQYSSGDSGVPSCTTSYPFTDLPFPSLTTIDRDLALACMADLADLSGLASVSSIGGGVRLRKLGTIGAIGLPSLTSLAETLTIGGEGEDRYGSAWTDRISAPDMSGFEALTYVGGDLTIIGPAALDGLDALQEVGGTLKVLSLSATDLSGLGALERVGGDFAIGEGTGPASLSGAGALSSIGGSLSVYDLTGSTFTPSGLDALTTVDTVYFGDVDGLLDLSGFPAVTTLASGLYVEDNRDLVSFDGADGLTTLGGALWIIDNDDLADLTGLYGLTSVGSGISIRGNASITDADGNALVADIESVSGTVTVTGNGP